MLYPAQVAEFVHYVFGHDVALAVLVLYLSAHEYHAVVAHRAAVIADHVRFRHILALANVARLAIFRRGHDYALIVYLVARCEQLFELFE